MGISYAFKFPRDFRANNNNNKNRRQQKENLQKLYFMFAYFMALFCLRRKLHTNMKTKACCRLWSANITESSTKTPFNI